MNYIPPATAATPRAVSYGLNGVKRDNNGNGSRGQVGSGDSVTLSIISPSGHDLAARIEFFTNRIDARTRALRENPNGRNLAADAKDTAKDAHEVETLLTNLPAGDERKTVARSAIRFKRAQNAFTRAVVGQMTPKSGEPARSQEELKQIAAALAQSHRSSKNITSMIKGKKDLDDHQTFAELDDADRESDALYSQLMAVCAGLGIDSKAVESESGRDYGNDYSKSDSIAWLQNLFSDAYRNMQDAINGTKDQMTSEDKMQAEKREERIKGEKIKLQKKIDQLKMDIARMRNETDPAKVQRMKVQLAADLNSIYRSYTDSLAIYSKDEQMNIDLTLKNLKTEIS